MLSVLCPTIFIAVDRGTLARSRLRTAVRRKSCGMRSDKPACLQAVALNLCEGPSVELAPRGFALARRSLVKHERLMRADRRGRKMTHALERLLREPNDQIASRHLPPERRGLPRPQRREVPRALRLRLGAQRLQG